MNEYGVHARFNRFIIKTKTIGRFLVLFDYGNELLVDTDSEEKTPTTNPFELNSSASYTHIT